MSTQLIPVFTGEINHTQQPVCDARELYRFLDIKQQFGNWIGNRIRQYKFIQDIDFIVFNNFIKNPSNGGRPSTDYHLTLDMAKELAMVERNAKGREARRYFIDCERRLLTGLQPANDTPQLEQLQTENACLSAENTDLRAENQALQKKYINLLEYKTDILEQQTEQKPKKESKGPLTDEERQTIIRLHLSGYTRRQIVDEINRSESAVYSVIREYKAGGATG